MRPLLSTRLFDTLPLRARELELTRRRGFSGLEIFAGRHLDILDPHAGAILRQVVELAGLSAQWLYLPPPALARLGDEPSQEHFGHFVRSLEVPIVAVPAASFAGAPDRLRATVELAGARLAFDATHVDVRPLPPEIGLSWDLASANRPPVAEVLGPLARGRLLGIRVAHDQDGRRAVPGPEEASVLEEVWGQHAPGHLVYDVEDPAGFGGVADIEDVLDSLRAFQAGESRAHTESSGGVFWAAMAPG